MDTLTIADISLQHYVLICTERSNPKSRWIVTRGGEAILTTDRDALVRYKHQLEDYFRQHEYFIAEVNVIA